MHRVNYMRVAEDLFRHTLETCLHLTLTPTDMIHLSLAVMISSEDEGTYSGEMGCTIGSLAIIMTFGFVEMDNDILANALITKCEHIRTAEEHAVHKRWMSKRYSVYPYTIEHDCN